MLVLSLVLGLVYHFSDAGASKMRAMVRSGAKFAGLVQDPVQDSEIQKDLDQKLAGLKGSFIQANVENGVVTLAGTSPTKWESLHAETLASQVRGVKAINNQLQVEELDTSAAQDALTKAHK